MLAVRTASPHPVCRLAFAPCGRWFATAQPQHGVNLHDRGGGAVVRTVGHPRRPDCTGLTFFHGGAYLAATGSKGLEIVETATGTRIGYCDPRSLPGFTLETRGDRLLCGGPWAVYELGVAPGSPPVWIRTLWRHGEIRCLNPAPGGAWAVGFRGDGGPVAVDLAAGRPALSLRTPPCQARVAYGQGFPAVGTEADHVGVRGNMPYMASVWADYLPAVAFAEHAPRVALGDWNGVAVFDLHPAPPAPPADAAVPAPLPVAAPVFTLPPPDRWPAGRRWQPPLALTPDGRGLLILRPRQRVQLWDVDAGTLAAEWSWRLEAITCLAVAPDGLTAAAGGRFGRVLLWDLD